MPKTVKTGRRHLGDGHSSRHILRRICHAAVGHENPEQHYLGKAQSTPKSLLPLFHAFNGDSDMGRKVREVEAYLQLRSLESHERRQTDEIGMDPALSETRGKAVRQASDPETGRPC